MIHEINIFDVGASCVMTESKQRLTAVNFAALGTASANRDVSDAYAYVFTVNAA
jgi:hypothetical protein